MRIRDQIKRLNRGWGSVALLVVLFGMIAFTHWLARLRMDMASRRFAIMDDRTLQEMSIIDSIHDHLWIGAVYFVVFLAFLVWLEIRAWPRRTIWITFFVLALPMLAYVWSCWHIGNKFIMWSGIEG